MPGLVATFPAATRCQRRGPRRTCLPTPPRSRATGGSRAWTLDSSAWDDVVNVNLSMGTFIMTSRTTSLKSARTNRDCQVLRIQKLAFKSLGKLLLPPPSQVSNTIQAPACAAVFTFFAGVLAHTVPHARFGDRGCCTPELAALVAQGRGGLVGAHMSDEMNDSPASDTKCRPAGRQRMPIADCAR